MVSLSLVSFAVSTEKHDTASGLSAIASLSLGLSMSMIGSETSLITPSPPNGIKRRETSPWLPGMAISAGTRRRISFGPGRHGRWSSEISDMSSMDRLDESADEEEAMCTTEKLKNANPESVNETVSQTGLRRSRRNRGAPGGSVVRQGAIDLGGKRGDTVVIEMVNGEEAAEPASSEDGIVIALEPEEVEMKKMHNCAEQIVANHVEVSVAQSRVQSCT